MLLDVQLTHENTVLSVPIPIGKSKSNLYCLSDRYTLRAERNPFVNRANLNP